MRDREMVEFITARLPYGAAALMADKAKEMEISRSELLRRAVVAYLAGHRQPGEQRQAVQ